MARSLGRLLSDKDILSSEVEEMNARLEYVDELGNSLFSLGANQISDDVLDEIELDCWSNIAAPDLSRHGITGWMINVSWSSEFTQAQLLQQLDSDVVDRIGDVLPIVGSDLRQWFSSQGTLLKRVVDRAFSAQSLVCLVAYLMAMNILLLDVLSLIAKRRMFQSD